jgi:hypothetical protein
MRQRHRIVPQRLARVSHNPHAAKPPAQLQPRVELKTQRLWGVVQPDPELLKKLKPKITPESS